MGQAYLVTEHRDPVGDNPVGNAISTSIALDSQRLRQQQSESYSRALDIQQKAQTLKGLRDQYELVGSKSPAGQQIQQKLLNLVGVEYDPDSTDPETLGSVTDNLIKGYDRTATDKTLSTTQKQEWIYSQILAANEALGQYGGTKTEQKARAEGVKQIGKSMIDTTMLGAKTEDFGVRSGIIEGRMSRLQDDRQAGAEALVDYKKARGVGTGAGRTSREEIDSSATYASIRKGFESRPGWSRMPPAEQDALLAEAYNRAKSVVRGTRTDVPGQDPAAVGPPPGAGIRKDLPPPASAPVTISSGNPDTDEMVGEIKKAFIDLNTMPTGKEKLEEIIQRAIRAGFDIGYDPSDMSIVSGKKRPGDAEILDGLIKSNFQSE